MDLNFCDLGRFKPLKRNKLFLCSISVSLKQKESVRIAPEREYLCLYCKGGGWAGVREQDWNSWELVMLYAGRYI